MKTLLLMTALFAGTNALAALSPYYDSIERIETVLASHPLAQVTARPITSIRETGPLTYEVIAGNCSTQVTLEARLPSMPGKTTYAVQAVSQASCP